MKVENNGNDADHERWWRDDARDDHNDDNNDDDDK